MDKMSSFVFVFGCASLCTHVEYKILELEFDAHYYLIMGLACEVKK
jgi:hypothetical protein